MSVARSLAAAGVHVTALGHSASPVRHSRACARFVDLGREDGVQDRWLRWLAGAPAGAVLLPCDDDALELLVDAPADPDAPGAARSSRRPTPSPSTCSTRTART